MNSEDPSNQYELIKKLSSVTSKAYLKHLNWEDTENNRDIIVEFMSHFNYAISASGVTIVYSEALQPFFITLLKAHFEILKVEDKDLSEEEWDKVENRFLFKEYKRRPEYKGYKMLFKQVLQPGTQYY